MLKRCFQGDHPSFGYTFVNDLFKCKWNEITNEITNISMHIHMLASVCRLMGVCPTLSYQKPCHVEKAFDKKSICF